MHRSEVPAYQHVSFVDSGYRIEKSHLDALASLTTLHNESVNIWTMILFAAISICLQPQKSSVALLMLTLSALVHLPFSVGNHLFSAIDEPTHAQWRKMDLIAIFVAIVLLTFALSHHSLENGSVVLMIISIMICAVATYFIAKDPHADTDRARRRYTAGVSAGVLMYLLPMLSAWRWDRSARSVAIATTMASLGLAGICFTTHFPECTAPGVFDMFGSSHQIMHALIGAAHLAEFAFIQTYLA